jgi:hypothetical protein
MDGLRGTSHPTHPKSFTSVILSVMPLIQNIKAQLNPLCAIVIKHSVIGQHRVPVALRGLGLHLSL